MKQIKHKFRSKPGSDPHGGLRGSGQKVKIKLFQNMVMLHIKLNRITNAAAWKQIFFAHRPGSPPPPPNAGSEVKI